MQIGSLFMALGFDVDDKKLGEFSDKVGVLRGGMATLGGTAAATVAALSAMTFAAADTALEIKNIADQTRSSQDEIRQFYSVLKGAYPKASMEDALRITTALRDTIVDAEWGEGQSGIAAMLGISPADISAMNEMQLLGAMRNAVSQQGMSKEKVDQLMEQLGFPRDFGRVLRMSEGRFQELSDRSRITDNEVDKLNEFSFALGEATYQLGVMGEKLGAMFAPVVKGVIEPMGWFASETSKIVDGLNAVVAGEENPNIPKRKPTSIPVSRDIVMESIDLGVNSQKAEEVAKKWLDLKTGNTTTNNIYVEGTANPQDTAESLFDMMESQKNRELSAEIPNSAYGGIR